MNLLPKRPVDHFDPNRRYSLLALDPGNEKTGWALWGEGDGDRPSATGDHPNADIRQMLRVARDMGLLEQVAIEFPVARPGGTERNELFLTCREAGRFQEILEEDIEVRAQAEAEGPVLAIAGPDPISLYFADRADVKIHLCKKAAAKDRDVREAIIKRFGGKEVALAKAKAATNPSGKKAGLIAPATPAGPLVGVAGDAWQALAVGLAWRDGALPDAAERQRRAAARARAKAEKALRAAKKLTDRQEVSELIEIL